MNNDNILVELVSKFHPHDRYAVKWNKAEEPDLQVMLEKLGINTLIYIIMVHEKDSVEESELEKRIEALRGKIKEPFFEGLRPETFGARINPHGYQGHMHIATFNPDSHKVQPPPPMGTWYPNGYAQQPIPPMGLWHPSMGTPQQPLQPQAPPQPKAPSMWGDSPMNTPQIPPQQHQPYKGRSDRDFFNDWTFPRKDEKNEKVFKQWKTAITANDSIKEYDFMGLSDTERAGFEKLFEVICAARESKDEKAITSADYIEILIKEFVTGNTAHTRHHLSSISREMFKIFDVIDSEDIKEKINKIWDDLNSARNALCIRPENEQYQNRNKSDTAAKNKERTKVNTSVVKDSITKGEQNDPDTKQPEQQHRNPFGTTDFGQRTGFPKKSPQDEKNERVFEQWINAITTDDSIEGYDFMGLSNNERAGFKKLYEIIRIAKANEDPNIVECGNHMELLIKKYVSNHTEYTELFICRISGDMFRLADAFNCDDIEIKIGNIWNDLMTTRHFSKVSPEEIQYFKRNRSAFKDGKTKEGQNMSDTKQPAENMITKVKINPSIPQAGSESTPTDNDFHVGSQPKDKCFNDNEVTILKAWSEVLIIPYEEIASGVNDISNIDMDLIVNRMYPCNNSFRPLKKGEKGYGAVGEFIKLWNNFVGSNKEEHKAIYRGEGLRGYDYVIDIMPAIDCECEEIKSYLIHCLNVYFEDIVCHKYKPDYKCAKENILLLFRDGFITLELACVLLNTTDNTKLYNYVLDVDNTGEDNKEEKTNDQPVTNKEEPAFKFKRPDVKPNNIKHSDLVDFFGGELEMYGVNINAVLYLFLNSKNITKFHNMNSSHYMTIIVSLLSDKFLEEGGCSKRLERDIYLLKNAAVNWVMATHISYISKDENSKERMKVLKSLKDSIGNKQLYKKIAAVFNEENPGLTGIITTHFDV